MATRRSPSRIVANLFIGAAPLAIALGMAQPAKAQFSSGPGASTNAGTIGSQYTQTGTGGAAFSGATSNTAGADATTITLGSSRTILNWNSFNLNAGDTLNYVFGANNNIVLNRVTGGSGTQINGSITGSIGAVGGTTGGNVWFLDSAGIAVGGNAIIDVGGLLLGTQGLTDADFFNDNIFDFSGTGSGSVTVASDLGAVGQLRAANGAITILAPQIVFSGRANASGSNALIGANSAQIIFNNNLDAYVGIQIADGASQNVSVGSSATFDAGAVASGGRTIIAAAGTSNLGQILFTSTSADRVDFIEGDVVIYSAASTSGTSTPRTIVADGLVQAIEAGTAPNLLPGYLSVTGGSADIRGAGNVVVDGLTVAGGSARIEAGSLLTVNSSVSTSGDYSIIADDWTGTGVFSPTFTGGAGVGDFNITDTAFGLTIGSRNAPDDLRISTVNGDLTVIGGALTATNSIELATIGSGNIRLESPVVEGGADGTVKLNSAGSITQTSSGGITTGTLTGSSVGQTQLGTATNQLGRIGNFTAQGLYVKDAGNLTISGAVIDSGTGNLDIEITSPGTLSIINSTIRSAGSGQTRLRAATTGGTVLSNSTIEGGSAVNFSGSLSNGGSSLIDSDGDVNLDTSLHSIGGTLSITSGGDINMYGTLNGPGALNLNAGSDIYWNAYAGATALGSLSATAADRMFLVTGITTIGSQTFNAPVVNVADATLASTGSGAISFNGAVEGWAGGRTLFVNTAGVTSFNGNVGATTALAMLTTDAAGSNRIAGNVTTTGAQSWGGATSLTAGDHRITGSKVAFGGFVESVNAADTVNLRVDATGTGATDGVSFGGQINEIDGLAVTGRTAGFTGTQNRIGTLAANLTAGGLALTTNRSLAVGSVLGVTGITAGSGQNVDLIVDAISGLADLNLNAGITVGGGGDVSLRAYDGGIFGSGLITADHVLLHGAKSGLGTSSQALQTQVTSLTAAGGNGGVYVNEVNGLRLQSTNIANGGCGGTCTLGFVNGGSSFQLTAAGPITLADSIFAIGAINLAASTGGNISLGTNRIDGQDVSLTAAGSIDASAGAMIVARDIALTAGDFIGTILADGTLQESRDLSVTDTLGGLTLNSLSSARNLAITTNGGGGLQVGGLTTGGSATLNSSGDLALINSTSSIAGNLTGTAAGAVTVEGLHHAIGDVTLRSTGGALSIGSLGKLIGVNVTLATSTEFSNASGADAISASNRWLIYSAAPAGNSFGGLNSGNTAIWNATYGSFNPAGVSGNRYLFAYQPLLTVTTVDASKTYGTDLSSSTSSLYTLSGLQPGVAGAFLADTATSVFSGAPAISSVGLAANADVAGGPYAITAAAGSMAATSGYALAFAGNGKLTINPKMINGSVAANGKTYDGTTAATGSVSLAGVLAGDEVSAAALLAFADKNAGSDKVVTISGGSLSGADAGNYTLSLPASTLATILQKGLTGAATVDNKTYDGTTTATGSVGLSGVIAGDEVAAAALFAFADKNAGSNKVVTISSSSLSGADARNYTLSLPASTLASIFQKAITATATANDKTYDGTTAASGSIGFNGVIAGDELTATATFAFGDKNAGSDKTVTVSGVAMGGADAGNYAVTLPVSALADILQRSITANVIANDKTYDGTIAATGSVSLNGVLAGDSVAATGATFAFADKNAGSGKTVSVGGITLTGTDAGNYSVILPTSVLAEIFKKAITATINADSKVYDGTNAATGSLALSGVVSGDSVGASATLAFADKNAGTGKAVSATNASLSGTDAGNYTLSALANGSASITPKAINGSVTANGKTYDGTTGTTGSVSLNGVIAGDQVSGSASFAFADKNAGSGKTVSVSGAALSGTDAANYSVTLPASAVADILQKALSGAVTADNKVYDGTTAATGSITLSGVIAGDSVGANASYTFADKDAGNGKTVTVANGGLTGADAGNYKLGLPASVVADILRRAITVSADAKSKIEGADDPALTYVVTQGSLIAGDSFSGGLTRAPGEGPGSYAIGQGSLVATANYTLTFVGNSLSITAKPTNPSVVAPVLETDTLMRFLRVQAEIRPGLLTVIDERDPTCTTGEEMGRECSAKPRPKLSSR